MFCTNCGRQNPDESRFCVGCGTNLSVPPPDLNRPGSVKTFAQGKKPVSALVMSLLIVGLGQFYNGDVKKGLLMLVGAIVGGLASFSLLWWVMSLWSAVDAYRVANRQVPLWV
jgi:TM2 domain-containing membrane protein YozV